MRLFYILLISLFSLSTYSQKLISSKFLKNRNKQYFFNQIGFQVPYEVDMYQIKYFTENTQGILDTASGLVCVPKDIKTVFQLVGYMHGTVGSRFEVPSYESYEDLIPSIYAAFGFISFAPDYLGLGANNGVHPYLWAEGTANDAVQMMKATEEFILSLNRKNSKDLFLSGYSQGGHSSAACQRLVESQYPEYNVLASTHMSGPYSISSAMRNLVTSNQSYELVAYVVNIALGLNEIYDIIPNDDLNEFFNPEFVPFIAQYKNEEIDLWTLNAKLKDLLNTNYGGSFPKKLVKEAILNRITNDENDPINVALRENDVYDWKPLASTRLLYCKADDQVTYTNSLTAQEAMKAKGATDVTAIDVKSDANHTQCVNPAVTNSLFHFLGFQKLSTDLEILTEDVLEIFPNPVFDMIHVDLKDNHDIIEYQMYDLQGRLILNGELENNMIDCQSLQDGMYILSVIDEEKRALHTKIIKN